MLFLQNLQLQDGTGTVLEGVGLGLLATAIVGVLTFWLHARLPYRRMLIATGVLVGVVLVVMIGGTALSFVELGLAAHATTRRSRCPSGSARGSRSTRCWETLAAQVLAATFVVGSYYAAEYVKVKRPRRRGEAVGAQPA